MGILQPEKSSKSTSTQSPLLVAPANVKKKDQKIGKFVFDRGREIILKLGDILLHIPPSFLTEGPHNLKKEIRFKVDDLSSNIAQGKATLRLSTIAKCCPEILRDITGVEDLNINLPLQKLIEQLGDPLTGNIDFEEQLNLFDIQLNHPTTKNDLETPTTLEDKTVKSVLPLEEVHSPPQEKPKIEPVPITRNKIQFNLAVILRALSNNFLNQSLEPIDESIRISFPFDSIEPQLSSGKVEIPLDEFVSALPAEYKAHFPVGEDVMVPIPIEEVFRNLPGQQALEPFEDHSVLEIFPKPTIESPENSILSEDIMETMEQVESPDILNSSPPNQSSVNSPINDVINLISELPGISSCIITLRQGTGNEVPEEIEVKKVGENATEFSDSINRYANEMKIGEVKNITLLCERYLMSFFVP